MDRKTFIKQSLLGMASITTLPALKRFSDALPVEDKKLPMLFIGHGSPMNAIEDNEFTRGWREMGKTLPKPKAILCVSAHWETKGTFVTAMEQPKTIHDFGGFPQALFDVQYPAPGSPAMASEVKAAAASVEIGLDHQWGLDHGAWSILKPMFPGADIPVIQLSLDYTKDAKWHYEFAKELSALRSKGVLIIGSGNIVHNLGRIDWKNPNGKYDWAEEAITKIKGLIDAGDFKSLVNYSSLGRSVAMAVPSPDHYLPLLYVLGLKGDKESISYFNDKTVLGSITMTSLLVK